MNSAIALAKALKSNGASNEEILAFLQDESPPSTKTSNERLVRAAGLNSTQLAMYDSLVELGGRAMLGAIRANCGTTPNCNNGRIAYSTASYTMDVLYRKGLVKYEGGCYVVV